MKRPIPFLLAMFLLACNAPTAPPVTVIGEAVDACQVITQGDGWLGPVDGTSGGYWHFDIPKIINPDGSNNTHIADVEATYYPTGPGHPYVNACYSWHPADWNLPGGGMRPKEFMNMANDYAGDYAALWLRDYDDTSYSVECYMLLNTYSTTGQSWLKLGCVWSPWGP